MARPQAYAPEQDQKYQILCRCDRGAYEHCDYAVDRQERDQIIEQTRIAYKGGWEFKSILLPRKYWPKKKPKIS